MAYTLRRDGLDGLVWKGVLNYRKIFINIGGGRINGVGEALSSNHIALKDIIF